MRRILISFVAVAALFLASAGSVAAVMPPVEDCTENGQIYINSEGAWRCYLLGPGIGRWEKIGTQGTYATSKGYTYISSSLGCTWNQSFIESDYLGAATNSALSIVYWYQYTTACGPQPIYQPINEVRVKDVMQRNGVTVYDSGWRYNSTSSPAMFVHPNMGTVPDYGSGYYRSIGYGSVWQGGAWRGTSLTTAQVWMQ